MLPDRVVEVDGREDELERLRRERDEARAKLQANARAQYSRSLSPVPGPIPIPYAPTAPHIASAPSEPPVSLRPGRDLVLNVVRRVDSKWLGVALVLAVIVWALGGPGGIRELIAAWRASQYTAEITALDKRVTQLEQQKSKAEAAARAVFEEERSFRADNAQVFRKLGVHWPMPDGVPPRRPLEFVTPLRQPGQVKGGLSVVVVQPVPLPASPP